MSEEVVGTDAPEVDLFAGVEGYQEASKRPKGLYFSIFKYKIAKRQDEMPLEGEKGWTGPWETENPRTGEKKNSYAFFYDRLVAKVINVERVKKEFSAEQGGGKVINWNIRLIANGKKSTLQFTQKDVSLKRFLKMARNLDFSKPICFSAWESKDNGKSKQAFALFQASDELIAGANTSEGIAKLRNIDNWSVVHEYWARPKGEDGKPLPDTDYKGTDGTVMPRGFKDEEMDEWDYKEQDKFLISQFREHIAPIMEELAVKYGVDKEASDEDGTPLFTGGTAAPIPVVTTAPVNPLSVSMADLITGGQQAKCKQLAEQIGKDVNAISQKLVGANLDELSQGAASYLQYRMQQRVDKMALEGSAQESAPVVEAPAPVPPPPAIIAPAVTPPPTDEDEWGEAAPAPATIAVPPKAVTVDDDDDDDWGEPASPKV